jgi:hypothetical protein
LSSRFMCWDSTCDIEHEASRYASARTNSLSLPVPRRNLQMLLDARSSEITNDSSYCGALMLSATVLNWSQLMCGGSVGDHE